MRSSEIHDCAGIVGRGRRRIMPAMMASILLPAIVVVALVLVLGAATAMADDFVLVRNAKNVTTSASRSEIKDMSVGKRKTWRSGAAVQLVLPPAGSSAMGWFAISVVGVSEGALMSKIKQEVFKGELKKPVSAGSDKDILSVVAADPGAFGVIRAEGVKSLPPEVAVLAVR